MDIIRHVRLCYRETSGGDFGQGDVLLGHGTILDMLDYRCYRGDLRWFCLARGCLG